MHGDSEHCYVTCSLFRVLSPSQKGAKKKGGKKKDKKEEATEKAADFAACPFCESDDQDDMVCCDRCESWIHSRSSRSHDHPSRTLCTSSSHFVVCSCAGLTEDELAALDEDDEVPRVCWAIVMRCYGWLCH